MVKSISALIGAVLPVRSPVLPASSMGLTPLAQGTVLSLAQHALKPLHGQGSLYTLAYEKCPLGI